MQSYVYLSIYKKGAKEWQADKEVIDSRQYGYSRQTGSGNRSVSSHSRYSGRGGQAYVEGSAARAYDVEPLRREQERKRREEEYQRRERERRNPYSRTVELPGVHRASVLFLIMAVAAVFYLCFSYVQTQNQLHEQRQQVRSDPV